MTLVNVNRFHCTNTNTSSLQTIQYKAPTSPHHLHHEYHHQQRYQSQQQLQIQQINNLTSTPTSNNNNKLLNSSTNDILSHHHNQQTSPITPNIHAHPCHHQRRRSSAYDNSSDVSSFTSSCSSSTSSPALFADKSRLIRLKRSPDDQCKSLGFSIRGGWEHGIGFFVSHVQSGSLAEQRGLCAGDEILQINGFPLERVIHDEVIALIRMSPEDLTLRVRSIGLVPFKDCADQLSWKTANAMLIDAPPAPFSSPSSQHAPSNALHQHHSNVSLYQESQVMIVCQEQSLGCSVVKGPSNLPGIFVQSVKQGRTACNAGLEVGDEIVKVNNTEVASIGFDGAISMLKSLRSFSLIVRKGVAKHLFVSSESSSTVCTKRFTTTIVEQQQQQQQQQQHQQLQQHPQIQLPSASASTGTTSLEILSQQTTTTTAKSSCCCSGRQTEESEILAKATNAMENSLRLLQQVCEKEEKLALAEQKLSQEQQKLRQQQANLQISVTSTGCPASSASSSLSGIGGAIDNGHRQHHHHHHHHGHHGTHSQVSLPAPPLPPLMPSQSQTVSSQSSSSSSSAAFEASKSVVGTVNGTFSSVAASMVSKSFLEEIKSLGENGTKRYLRPINGADTLPAQGKNSSNAASIAFQANQLVKSKILKRMPFAEDERTQRQHELLMEEFKVAHMKMFGSKAFTKKSHQQQQQHQQSTARDQEEHSGTKVKHENELIKATSTVSASSTTATVSKVGENPASSSCSTTPGTSNNNRDSAPHSANESDQETAAATSSNRITIKVLSTTTTTTTSASRRE